MEQTCHYETQFKFILIFIILKENETFKTIEK